MKPQFLFIGLGNVGKEYESTRHNIGFLAADALAKELSATDWSDSPRFLAAVAEAELDGAAILLVKPSTFMNRSGEAVRKLVDFYKLDPARQILVCCDDIDLPLGTHRLRMNGGAGTHNGLKSIVETLGENFPRLRVGIGPNPPDRDLAEWVLSTMTEEEKLKLQKSMQILLTKVQELL